MLNFLYSVFSCKHRGPGVDPLPTGGSSVPWGSITNQIAHPAGPWHCVWWTDDMGERRLSTWSREWVLYFFWPNIIHDLFLSFVKWNGWWTETLELMMGLSIEWAEKWWNLTNIGWLSGIICFAITLHELLLSLSFDACLLLNETICQLTDLIKSGCYSSKDWPPQPVLLWAVRINEVVLVETELFLENNTFILFFSVGSSINWWKLLHGSDNEGSYTWFSGELNHTGEWSLGVSVTFHLTRVKGHDECDSCWRLKGSCVFLGVVLLSTGCWVEVSVYCFPSVSSLYFSEIKYIPEGCLKSWDHVNVFCDLICWPYKATKKKSLTALDNLSMCVLQLLSSVFRVVISSLSLLWLVL